MRAEWPGGNSVRTMVGLTDGQVAQYREQGWVAPIDVLTAAEAADALGELEAAEVDFPDDLHAENRNNAHLVLPFLAELAVHEVVVDCVRSLVADPVALSSSVLFIKEPQTGSHVTWHQDATYMGLEPDDFVTACAGKGCFRVDDFLVSIQYIQNGALSFAGFDAYTFQCGFGRCDLCLTAFDLCFCGLISAPVFCDCALDPLPCFLNFIVLPFGRPPCLTKT